MSSSSEVPPPPINISITPVTQEQPFSSKEDENLFMSQLQESMRSGTAILPSSEIPIAPTTQWTTDATSIPNFLPNATLNKLTDQEMFVDKRTDDKKTKPQHWTDTIYDEFRIPILLIFMYFLFQLPFFRQNLKKYVPILFHLDGNYNLGGLIVTSIMYGGGIYLILKTLSQIAEFLSSGIK